MLRRKLVWTAIVTGWWLTEGLISSIQAISMRPDLDRGAALTTNMASALLWIPFTLLALWLAARFPLRPLPQLAGLGITILGRAMSVVLLNDLVHWYDVVPPFGELLVTSFFNNLVFYFMTAGVAHAVHFARQHALREQQLAVAELNALRAQIRPHFLFNALNTIASMVHDRPDTADRMITQLSALLRSSLSADSRQEVPLREELAVVEAYLDIELARFEDRLTVSWEISAETEGALIPPLAVQPLVENAILHGVGPRAAHGAVTVSARRVNGSLEVSVADDGVGLSPGGSGVGLSSTRARLVQLYGKAASLDVGPRSGGGVNATIVVPFRLSPRKVPA